MGLGWSLRDNDWNKLRQILQQIASLRFGPDATPTFAGLDIEGSITISGGISANELTLGGLTASQALMTVGTCSWANPLSSRGYIVSAGSNAMVRLNSG